MTTLRLYLARAWLGAFAASLAAAAALYLGIDVLGRVGEVLPFAPAASKLAAYFLFKLPKILFDVFPAACLLATLASLGALDRNRELAAMRAAVSGMAGSIRRARWRSASHSRCSTSPTRGLSSSCFHMRKGAVSTPACPIPPRAAVWAKT